MNHQTKIMSVDWVNVIPFFILHGIAVATLFLFPWSWSMIGLAIGSYYLRMVAITAGYHRYFSHRSFKTSRFFQFILAFLAQTSAQKGALWWAAHHRHHHRFSDTAEDIHSPIQKGFWYSQLGWILSSRYSKTEWKYIQDFAKYPELVWLNKNHLVAPTAYALLFFLFGGFPALCWGFFLSTAFLYQGTFSINTLTHLFGKVRYRSGDSSRNSLILAIVTCGEGWHNNHHHYQASVNQGWFWWEVDLSFYVLKFLSWLGIVWDLRIVPDHIRANTIDGGARKREASQLLSGMRTDSYPSVGNCCGE